MIVEFFAEIINIILDRKKHGTKGTFVLVIMMLVFMAISVYLIS